MTESQETAVTETQNPAPAVEMAENGVHTQVQAEILKKPVLPLPEEQNVAPKVEKPAKPAEKVVGTPPKPDATSFEVSEAPTETSKSPMAVLAEAIMALEQKKRFSEELVNNLNLIAKY